MGVGGKGDLGVALVAEIGCLLGSQNGGEAIAFKRGRGPLSPRARKAEG